MWETLDLCLKVVDTQSLDLLVPRIAQMVRSGVGLNTRYAEILDLDQSYSCNLMIWCFSLFFFNCNSAYFIISL